MGGMVLKFQTNNINHPEQQSHTFKDIVILNFHTQLPNTWYKWK